MPTGRVRGAAAPGPEGEHPRVDVGAPPASEGGGEKQTGEGAGVVPSRSRSGKCHPAHGQGDSAPIAWNEEEEGKKVRT